MKALYSNAVTLDSGARGATTSFTERGQGDVLIAWENEAYLALQEPGKDKFEIVTPSLSILAEPPVSVVDKVVDKRGTRKVAEAYPQYLYSPVGQTWLQELLPPPRQGCCRQVRQAVWYGEPVHHRRAVRWLDQSPETHFADGGVLDQISGKK